MSSPSTACGQTRTWTLREGVEKLGFEGFGKTTHGQSWHIIRDGRPVCGNYRVAGGVHEESPAMPCHNCRDLLWSALLEGEVR